MALRLLTAGYNPLVKQIYFKLYHDRVPSVHTVCTAHVSHHHRLAGDHRGLGNRLTNSHGRFHMSYKCDGNPINPHTMCATAGFTLV